MTVEKYNDFLEIDVTASEEKSEENVFVDHSLIIKCFLEILIIKFEKFILGIKH